MNRVKTGLALLGTVTLLAGSVGAAGAAEPPASLAPANIVFWDFSATDSQTTALNEIIASFEAATRVSRSSSSSVQRTPPRTHSGPRSAPTHSRTSTGTGRAWDWAASSSRLEPART